MNRRTLLSGLTLLFSQAPLLASPALAQPMAPPKASAVPVFGYEVLERVAHPRENFVQGLEFRGDTLYVGTGGYGTSRLREYRFPQMQLLREYALPESVFGEGITRLDDRIYQLTWRAGIGLAYNAETLEPLGKFSIGTEGWGLTNNGESLIFSDGSDKLYYLSPQTLSRQRVLPVTLAGNPLPRLNELEWIDGEIWANVWRSNQLVRIDPESGEVTAIVDLRGLLAPEDRDETTDVLNGIAYHRASESVWVTGKRWPWLYRIRLTGPTAKPGQSG